MSKAPDTPKVFNSYTICQLRLERPARLLYALPRGVSGKLQPNLLREQASRANEAEFDGEL